MGSKQTVWICYAAGTGCWLRSCYLAAKAVGSMDFAGAENEQQVITILASVTAKHAQSSEWRLLAALIMLAGLMMHVLRTKLKRKEITLMAPE